MNGKVKKLDNNRRSYFFDQALYPETWDSMSDEELLDLYRESTDRETPLLIICYLMRRHRAALLAICFRFLKGRDAVEDFVHEVYLKLVKVLPTIDIKRFGGFLSTVVRRMNLDEVKRKKPDADIEHIEEPDTNQDLHTEDFKLDNPLSPEKLEGFKEKGILSEMEHQCIKMRLEGMEPRYIAKVIDSAILGMEEQNPDEEALEEYLLKKRKKVFGAIERARKKLKKHLEKDFQTYFKD